jgi:hypothetical protein
MKRSLLLLLTILTSEIIFGQSDYDKFYQALIKGDTVLAAKIEKTSAYRTEPIEEKKFPVKNITEHTFKIGINIIKDLIVGLFNFENQNDNKFLNAIFYNYMSLNDRSEKNKMPILFDVETVKDSIFSVHYFSKQDTSNDIYVHDFGFTWFSKLYFSKGQPLEYRTAFIIKLTKISNDSTKLSIIAEDPKVINGIAGFGPHGPIAKETKVQPSSIEEYSLLLFIADKLGDSNLAPLKLPNDK